MSETTTTETTTEVTETETPDTGPDLNAEVEKWKQLARKHEERAKANSTAAKQLEELQKAAMTDQEKAVAQARAEARAEAMREFGTGRVDDAVRAIFAGRSADVEALLEGLDKTKFLTDDGEPDREVITAWADRISPPPDPNAPPAFPDLGQGARPNSSLALNGDPLERALRTSLGIN